MLAIIRHGFFPRWGEGVLLSAAPFFSRPRYALRKASKVDIGCESPSRVSRDNLPIVPSPCQAFIKYSINEFGDDPDKHKWVFQHPRTQGLALNAFFLRTPSFDLLNYLFKFLLLIHLLHDKNHHYSLYSGALLFDSLVSKPLLGFKPSRKSGEKKR